jgi:hypothetical protein
MLEMSDVVRTRPVDLVAWAMEIERLSRTDTAAAAGELTRLGAAIGAERRRRPLPGNDAAVSVRPWMLQFDEYLADLARRLRSGHVLGVVGLARRVHQFVVNLGLEHASTEQGSAAASAHH